MSGQAGLKHASAELTRLENKREGRRGAAGRAAVLRRAPSDSDCSGETASLSADSGDRPARPPPPAPRTHKNRSRRRGSEWEVLEGLKDGQRFDKRPDVFNGYLHKKRKWPLKGWHKRFFVIDGGILVYARSAADVSRGRLHGSVDVGLSVISAKARRRRIDIDADEFIYHLRAKTPDVFRTWLNVLKAHRLYRQHLLTFGARESVPKIHAPLDDLPTDTSSRTSITSTFNNGSHQTKRQMNNSLVYTLYDLRTNYDNKIKSRPLDINNGDQNIVEEEIFSLIGGMEKNVEDIKEKKYEFTELQETYHRKENIGLMLSVDKTQDYGNNLHNKDSIYNMNCCNYCTSSDDKQKQTEHVDNGVDTPTYFFFSRKDREVSANPPIRKSKKSTNVFKYRNTYDEPKLRKPLSRVMLLTKYKLKQYDTIDVYDAEALVTKKIRKKHVDIQTVERKEHKNIQNTLTQSEYDAIAEKLMVSIITNNGNKPYTKICINEVVRELYDIKQDDTCDHPVKNLFRGLLEYWLNNTFSANWKDLLKKSKSIHRQSNRYFSKDETTSIVDLPKISKSTQFRGISDLIKDKALEIPVQNPGKKNRLACKINDSFEKERRIQELERILKNTIYICETIQSSHSKERDIKITKKLINNLDQFSHQNNINKSDEEGICDNSNSSNELPKIQETIKHLISETSIPPGIAKEFFGAYLNLLRQSPSDEESTSSSDESQTNTCNKCDITAEPIQKKASKSVSTNDPCAYKEQRVDPGQLYLKNILDTITTIFSRNTNTDAKQQPTNNWPEIKVHDELGRVTRVSGENNSLVIDISKYDLEHISLTSDPSIKGIASITMKLKERPPDSGEPKSVNLNLKFANTSEINKNSKCPVESSYSDKIFYMKSTKCNSITRIPYAQVQNYIEKEDKELRPYLSSHADSDKINFKDIQVKDCSSLSCGTSKAFRIFEQTRNTVHAYTNKTQKGDRDSLKNINDEDLQSCYILSFKKGSYTSKYQKKKSSNGEEGHGNYSQKHERVSLHLGPGEVSMFDKAPKVIDETYILMLLENLTILSKNFPNINKDINNFYMKLRKKLEKIITTSKSNGLGLLGKIYCEDSFSKGTEENETQFDENICPRATIIDKNFITTSTSNDSLNKNYSDKAIGSFVKKEILNKSIQVGVNEDNNMNDSGNVSRRKIFYKSYNISSTQTTSFSSLSSEEELQTAERATSRQNWYTVTCTRDCGISTLVKSVLDKADSSQNFRFRTQQRKKIDKEVLTTKKFKNIRKQSPEIRQNLIKEIALLSPSFKVSTQSQTEKKLRCLRKKTINNEFQVYQLYMSAKYEAKKSCSMLNFIVKSDRSDDLKTLYRCNSDTSYISGIVSPTPTRGPQAGFVAGTPGGRFAGWILDAGCPLESASRELGQAQLSVQQLQRLLAAIELQQQQHHDTDVSLEGASPNVKKDRRKFGLRKKKSSNKCSSVELQPPHVDLSNSHMCLSTVTAPPSPGGGAAPVPSSAASLPIVYPVDGCCDALLSVYRRPSTVDR